MFAGALAYYALFVHYGVNLDDEGTLLAQIYRTAQGELPYRDFHMGYTPGGHYYHAWLMRLFGPSVVPLRWSLAVCNALVSALLFAIGRRVMPTSFALLPAAAYPALMQVFPGDFASFNIPYPSWYVVLFGVAGFWMLLCYIESNHLGWIAAAGLATGICFAFKPNVGLFQLAGSGLVLLVTLEPLADGRAKRWQGLVWWLLLAGISLGLFAVFASQASRRDVEIFLLPIIVLLLVLAARRLARRSSDPPPHELLSSGLLYLAVMLAAIVPWVATFLHLLGADRFLRQILFVGTGFEQYYYASFHHAGPWDRMFLYGVVALVLAGVAVRLRRVPIWLLHAVGFVGTAAAVVFVARADMPQGAHEAVFSRLQDLSFTASLLTHWLGLGALLPVVWLPRHSAAERTRIAILVGAFAMYLQLYPRSDFAHLVNAVPLTMVVGAGLAFRFSEWFPETAGVRLGVATLMVGSVLGLIAYRVVPNLAAQIRWYDGPEWRPQVALALERLPIRLELGRAPRLQALRRTVTWLRANTREGEAIFPFPSIEILCFLADRPNATRHGYFFPGWPGHDVEAEVVATLRAAPPRVVVALQTTPYFFFDAPTYYYALRDFVRTHYRQVASFREYAILVRNDVPDGELVTPDDSGPDPGTPLDAEYGAALRAGGEQRLAAMQALADERLDFAWAPVVAALDDPSVQVRDAAVTALTAATSPDVAAALAAALRRDVVPPESRLAALRRLVVSGDTRIVRPLLEMLPAAADDRERKTMLSGLQVVAHKLALSDDWLGSWRPRDVTDEDFPDLDVLRRRLADPTEDPTFRSFLVQTLPRLGHEDLVPALWMAFGDDDLDFRVAAAKGLVRLGQDHHGLELIDLILPMIARAPRTAPSLVFEMQRRDPASVDARLLAVLRTDGFVYDRISVGWVAAATGDPVFRDELVRAMDGDCRELKLAALAGLGRLADPTTRPAIAHALADPDFTVRDFAARALAALPAP